MDCVCANFATRSPEFAKAPLDNSLKPYGSPNILQLYL